MLFHNLKQILRSLWRYKSFSIINFLGLSLGVTAIIIIFLIVDYERAFDSFHSNENIYRVVAKRDRADGINYSAAVPYSLAKLLRAESAAGVATEIHYMQNMNIKVGNNPPFIEKKILQTLYSLRFLIIQKLKTFGLKVILLLR